MRQSVKICLAAFFMLLMGSWNVSYAGTYATGLKITNPDSTAFDGQFQDGTGARLWFTINGNADTVVVRIKSGNNVVRSFDPILNLAAGTHNMEWDGKGNDNKLVPMGRYVVEVFTSDTGNSTSNWVQGWQSAVRKEGSGLSSRDIEVVNDPASPMFGNIILSESGGGHARLLVASSAGSEISDFGSEYYVTPPNGTDPWYMTFAPNGDLYVAAQQGTTGSLGNIRVFHNGVLTQTIEDTAAFPMPRGIAAFGSGSPTLLIAYANKLIRRTPNGVTDTLFTTAEAAGYLRDVAVDDSGYVYFSFGASSTTYSKLGRAKFISGTFTVLDTLTFPERVTHLNVFRGTNKNSNADDILYARVLGANGGVFKVDLDGKAFTKLFMPVSSTSAYHAIATDILGNIYFANPSTEWVRMYVPPMTAPTKWTSSAVIVVGTIGTKILDNFNVNAGHFGNPINSVNPIAPSFSGTTAGLSSSSAIRTASRNHGNGAGSALELSLTGAGGAFTVRMLSGIGTPANNDSLAPYGYIGYWARTSTAPAGAVFAIYMDDPGDGGAASKTSIGLPVINDGEWHLYQWNLEDESQWIGALAGSPAKKAMSGSRISIDGLKIWAPGGTSPWTLNIDDVSYNPYGTIGITAGVGDITGDGSASALDASLILQSVVGTITLTDDQTKIGDVNLSAEGTSVDAVDASLILGFVVGKIPYLPWTQPLAPFRSIKKNEPAQLAMTIYNARGNAGQTVEIPVAIPTDLAGIRSAEMKLLYNSSAIKIKNIKKTDLTKTFTIASNIQSGYVNVAMANGDALDEGGQLFIVEAEVLKASDNITIQAEDVKFNDTRISSVTSVGAGKIEVPSTYTLSQNYPNPFNPSTTIEYQLPQNGLVQLKIYDIAGREVATLINEVQNAGSYRVQWNATDVQGSKVASGVYFYRLTSGSFSQIKKMMLLK